MIDRLCDDFERLEISNSICRVHACTKVFKAAHVQLATAIKSEGAWPRDLQL